MFREEQCTVCGECLTWCPYIEIEAAEAGNEFQKLIDGESSRVVSECVSCMGCDEMCPEKANPFSLIIRRQEEQNEVARFEQAKTRMEGSYKAPSEVQKGVEGGPVIDICTVYPMTHWLFDGTLFEGATFLKGGDYYCGIGFYHIGLASPVEDKAASVVENVAKAGAEEVICYHDDCYTLFKVVAPELGLDVPFRPVSWPEFLYNRLRELEDQIQPIGKSVAYQRPCASRYTPEKDSYVDEIFNLVGVEKPSRSYEKIQSLCCGGGIVPRDWDLANRIKHQNLADAHAAGADIMVTLCPMCYANLRKRAPEHDLAIMTLSDLCRAALGEVEVGGA